MAEIRTHRVDHDEPRRHTTTSPTTLMSELRDVKQGGRRSAGFAPDLTRIAALTGSLVAGADSLRCGFADLRRH